MSKVQQIKRLLKQYSGKQVDLSKPLQKATQEELLTAISNNEAAKRNFILGMLEGVYYFNKQGELIVDTGLHCCGWKEFFDTYFTLQDIVDNEASLWDTFVRFDKQFYGTVRYYGLKMLVELAAR